MQLVKEDEIGIRDGIARRDLHAPIRTPTRQRTCEAWSSPKVHWFIGEEGSLVVVFGHGHGLIGYGLLFVSYVCLMQGTNLAPILISTYVEGPIIGLKDG